MEKQNGNAPKIDMREAIGNALRIGVTAACTIAVVSGVYYLVCHGSEPMPDYSRWTGEPASYTTLTGILKGVFALAAKDWIQLGVLVLMLTPIIRVVLSIVDFARQRDWLYVAITAIVLLVIIGNSLEGVG